MKKSQRTKTKLLSSLVLLLLSMTMFLGTTFAWFTDSVTSSGNKIQAGTLKVDLELLNEDGTYTSVRDMQEPIFNYTLWEPGYTEVKTLKIQNEGNLALKYQLNVVAEKESDLADVIDVYMSFGEQKPTSADDLNNTSIWWLCGTLTEMMINPEGFTQGKLLPVGTNYTGTTLGQNGVAVGEITATIALHMQETAGNEYQGKDLGNIDAVLVATQYSFEEDSFGTDYDKDAYVPDFTVSTTAELADAIKEGGTIQLAEDITLNHSSGDSAFVIESGTEVTLDLNGKTISSGGNFAGRALFENKYGASLTITGNGTIEMNPKPGNAAVVFAPRGTLIIENGTFKIPFVRGNDENPEGNNSVSALFAGIKANGADKSSTVVIYDGYFDGGYWRTDEFVPYNAYGKAGPDTLINLSAGETFTVYGGTFVGYNPAWGDEACTAYYKTVNSSAASREGQGVFLKGQTATDTTLPTGYTITKGVTTDGANRPTYTVNYVQP